MSYQYVRTLDWSNMTAGMHFIIQHTICNVIVPFSLRKTQWKQSYISKEYSAV